MAEKAGIWLNTFEPKATSQDKNSMKLEQGKKNKGKAGRKIKQMRTEIIGIENKHHKKHWWTDKSWALKNNKIEQTIWFSEKYNKIDKPIV